jgi:hypothetical protein
VILKIVNRARIHTGQKTEAGRANIGVLQPKVLSGRKTKPCFNSPYPLPQVASNSYARNVLASPSEPVPNMANPFFEHPILNSPYECPRRHWELDPQGQPTQRILENRRRAEFITPIPKPKKRKTAARQEEIVFDEGKGPVDDVT